MRFAAIDIETTGLDPNIYSVIEVAVVVGDTDNRDVETYKCPTFHSLIIPHNTAAWDIYAMSMHRKSGLLDELLLANVTECRESEVFGRMWRFLKDNFHGKIVAAGKNFGGFDRKFLDKMGNFGFSHRCIDPTHWFLRCDDSEPPNLMECLERASIGKSQEHRALDDARAVYKLVQEGYPR